VGCDLAGVDLIEGPDGRLTLLEINAMPAWQGLQSVSETDIAGHVAGWLRQRLRA
jgi:glutathione synthase/RimK-type ligase-like ATP-grasp enzyme